MNSFRKRCKTLKRKEAKVKNKEEIYENQKSHSLSRLRIDFVKWENINDPQNLALHKRLILISFSVH